MHLWFIFTLFACFGYVISDPIFVPYTDSKIQYVGRFDQGPKGTSFDMNGCEIKFTVQGTTTITAKLSQAKTKKFQPHAFLVYIDNVPQTKPISGSSCTYCTFDTHLVVNNSAINYPIVSNLDHGSHEIRIFKSTEIDFNERPYLTDNTPDYVTFYGLFLDAGKVLQPKAPVKRRIEFVGDSITAGYCNLCHGPVKVLNKSVENGILNFDTTFGQESFALSWPTLICEDLQAECHTAAWSGLGLIHNCCGGNVTMPMVWQRTLGSDSSSTWDFSHWVPDALVVNLGTNDGGSVKDPLYVKTYLDLVMNASKAYGPNLNVFLACGPMSSAYCSYVQTVISQATSAGIKAHFLDQTNFLNGTFGPSCCGHPGTKVDAAIAKSSAKVIGSIFNWKPLHTLSD